MHHDDVPAAAGDDLPLVREMEVEAGAAARLERHIVGETGLLGEGLEERRDSANAFVVQVGDRIGAIELHRRAGGEGEAVADEQHARGGLISDETDHPGG